MEYYQLLGKAAFWCNTSLTLVRYIYAEPIPRVNLHL